MRVGQGSRYKSKHIFVFKEFELQGCMDSAAHGTGFVIFIMFLLLEMDNIDPECCLMFTP